MLKDADDVSGGTHWLISRAYRREESLDAALPAALAMVKGASPLGGVQAEMGFLALMY